MAVERTWDQIDRWLSKCEWYGPITEEEWDVIDQMCVASVSECAHCGSSRKETKEWGWRMELRDPICCYPYQILEGAAA